MKAWRWVRLDVVHAIHDQQLAEHGGLSGVPNIGRLKAALARPQHLAAYGKPDAAALAAAYAYGLVRNHPFADGNKRTAWVIARLFLADNGRRLQFDPAEGVRMMEAAAAGTIAESEMAAWFRERILKA
ncbi:MAG: type II toxin-antitoxin system death-on-curing family toxin [Candidatus Korobacteraceae bacterium]